MSEGERGRSEYAVGSEESAETKFFGIRGVGGEGLDARTEELEAGTEE